MKNSLKAPCLFVLLLVISTISFAADYESPSRQPKEQGSYTPGDVLTGEDRDIFGGGPAEEETSVEYDKIFNDRLLEMAQAALGKECGLYHCQSGSKERFWGVSCEGQELAIKISESQVMDPGNEADIVARLIIAGLHLDSQWQKEQKRQTISTFLRIGIPIIMLSGLGVAVTLFSHKKNVRARAVPAACAGLGGFVAGCWAGLRWEESGRGKDRLRSKGYVTEQFARKLIDIDKSHASSDWMRTMAQTMIRDESKRTKVISKVLRETRWE